MCVCGLPVLLLSAPALAAESADEGFGLRWGAPLAEMATALVALWFARFFYKKVL